MFNPYVKELTMFCMKDPDDIPCQPLGKSERQKQEEAKPTVEKLKAGRDKTYRDFQFEQLRHELPASKTK